MIHLENIAYQYPNQKINIFNCFQFDFVKGDVVVITGENGCGKTTLLKILAGIVPEFTGGLYSGIRNLNGIPYDSIDPFQFGMLFDGHDLQFIQSRVDQEILYILEIQGFSQAEVNRRFNQLVEDFDLSDFLEREIQTLSSGETQIIKLALSFIHKSKIILMDEPFAHLDLIQKTKIMKILQRMKENDDLTYIVADHSPNTWEVFGKSVKYLNLSPENSKSVPLLHVLPQKNKPDQKIILNIKNIKFSYGTKSILSDFNRVISQGECIAISGRNGSGKTTFLNLLKGNLHPQLGEFVASHKLKIKLFANPASKNFFSLKLKEELNLEKGGIFSIFDLRKLMDQYVFDLSLGEQQKAAIEVIIKSKSDLILLDEPFLHLDENAKITLMSGLQKIKNEGISVVMTVHEPVIVSNITDQIWELGTL